MNSPDIPEPPSAASTISKAHNLIAVASGKGGVGKTFLSVTLAHALARRGRTTLLFDGDLGLANADIQLGLVPTRDLGGVMAGRITLAQSITPFQLGGFDVIAGRSGTGTLAALAPSRLAVLGADLVALAGRYDHVVMDLGAGVDRMVRQLAYSAGVRLVVATAEPTSMTDAYAFVKIAIADDRQTDIRLVINQARSQQEGERTYATLAKACETFLKFSPPLAGVVRRDRHVSESIRAQTPILIKSPSCEAALDIDGIAARLSDGRSRK
jgi:flagellar biosynthesis protein FlhG